MPKGDRLKLKADPEDGTTPIANLLLEAIAMAKISGLQKGALVYLMRKTYGWVGKDGKREKEAKITLGDWVRALDKDKSRISKALSELCEMNIIRRRVADVWGGYYYSLNTDISSWNSNSINLAKLADTVIVAHLPTVGEIATVGDNDNSGQKDQQSVETITVGTNEDSTVGGNDNSTVGGNDNTLPIYKETLNKDINKTVDKKPSTSFGKEIGGVISRLDKLRGYKTTKKEAEVGAIKRMLKDGKYTTDQIISTWEKLKTKPFWQSQELFMMTVESQIGAIIHGAQTGNKPNIKHQADVKIIN